MDDRYEFLKTTEHEGQIVALIADRSILGASGIASLRMAFNANAAPRIRNGVLMLTAAQLTERIPELEKQGMTTSVAAYQKAVTCIAAKQRAAAPKMQHSMG